MTESTSAVDQAVTARIQAAKRRNEDMLRRRAELAAARRRGLAARHAQKLGNLATAEDGDLRGSESNADVTETDTADAEQADVSFYDWIDHNSRRAAPFIALADIPGPWTTADELHAQLHRNDDDPRMCDLLAMMKDAWLAATEQWLHDCADCGNDSSTERYMVHDNVWAAAGMCGYGFLCIGCLEERLGRRLHTGDFLNVPLNYAPGFERSPRLTDRLASVLAGQGGTPVTTDDGSSRGDMPTVDEGQQ